MLTDAMTHELQGRGITDESITLEEQRLRARLKEQAALHLQDLKNAYQQKLSTLPMVGEDAGPLRR